MELQKGICFLCRNTTVIKPSETQKIYKLITLLLPKEILNPIELNNVQTMLRFCPICYHKLIIVKRTSKNVKTDISSEASKNCCILCKSEKNLFEIHNWPTFNVISEGMMFSKNNNCVTCSECLFYLETKNELKTKLLSKYPQLENKSLNNNETRKKWKLKLGPNIKLQLTPLSKQSKRKTSSRKRKFVEISNSFSNSEDSPSDKNINLDAIKNLRPLKHHKLFKNHKRIKMDYKFLNQIPYVLVTSSDLSNDTITCNEENVFREISNETNSPITSKNEDFRAQTESDKLNIKPLEQKNDLCNFKKQLVVNISRMNIEKYLMNNESDQDRQDLSDTFDTLQNLKQSEEDTTIDDDIMESCDNTIEDTETTFEIKNKRKSVSFAEEKNVEIEYFENDSSMKSRNQGNLEEDFEVIGKKHSKGILKRDENMGQDIETPIKQNKELHEEVDELVEIKKILDVPTMKEVEETNGSAQNEEDEHISQKASKLRERNRRNSYLIDEDTISDNSDSDNENLCKSKLQKETESDEDDMMKEKSNYKKKERNKKPKPKPLSKKKKQDTVVEIISDDDTNVNHSGNDQCITREDNVDERDNSEAASSERSDETVLKEENAEGGNDNTLVVPRPSVDTEKIKSGNVKKEKPKPLSKRRKSTNKLEDLDKEISSESNLDTSKNDGIAANRLNEEKIECKRIEESTPKNVKLDDKFESVEGEIISDDENRNDSNVKKVFSEVKGQDANNQIKSDKKLGEDTSIDEIVNETEKPAEENESESVSNVNGCSSEEIETTENTNVSKLCEEVVNKNEVDMNSIDSDKNNLKSITDDSSKSDPTSDSEVTQLVNKYLNEQDVDNTLKEGTHHGKNSDESTDEQKIESIASSSFNEFQKNEELGISEEDNENINSLISRIFPSDLSDIDESNLEDETGKRKVDDDELNVSREKKKKKVTFCEDVT